MVRGIKISTGFRAQGEVVTSGILVDFVDKPEHCNAIAPWMLEINSCSTVFVHDQWETLVEPPVKK